MKYLLEKPFYPHGPNGWAQTKMKCILSYDTDYFLNKMRIVNDMTKRISPTANGHVGGGFFSVVSSLALSSTQDLVNASREYSRELRDKRESRSIRSESMSDFCVTLMRSRSSLCCMR